MASVLIADDHAVVRAGYKTFLMTGGAVSDVGEASNGAALLKRMREKTWNLLILDIHLPDCTGMGILHEVRRDFPNTRVLVVMAFLKINTPSTRCGPALLDTSPRNARPMI